jgi:hypothetical protein
VFFTSAALFQSQKSLFNEKYGSKALGAVEEFVESFGQSVIDAVKKAEPIINSSMYKSILATVVALAGTIILSTPYKLFTPITKVTPNDAYNLAKKGIEDLISNVLEPATIKIHTLRDSMYEFFSTLDTVFASIKKWQGNLAVYISTGVNTVLGELGLAKDNIVKMISFIVTQSIAGLTEGFTTLRNFVSIEVQQGLSTLKNSVATLTNYVGTEIQQTINGLKVGYNTLTRQVDSQGERLGRIEEIESVDRPRVDALTKVVEQLPDTIKKQQDKNNDDTFSPFTELFKRISIDIFDELAIEGVLKYWRIVLPYMVSNIIDVKDVLTYFDKEMKV